jgi:hypothetical protein
MQMYIHIYTFTSPNSPMFKVWIQSASTPFKATILSYPKNNASKTSDKPITYSYTSIKLMSLFLNPTIARFPAEHSLYPPTTSS